MSAAEADGAQEDGAKKDGAQEDGAQEDGAQKDGAQEDGARRDAPIPFGPEIWTLDGDPVRMFRVLPFETRMTVVRLAGGGLWLHSPVAPTPARLEAAAALGPVEHLVAPNLIHSLGVAPWKAAHPEATVWVSPGFAARHPDLPADIAFGPRIRPPWSGEIEHGLIEGHALLDEVVFLHRRSATLIVTDLIQKHDPARERWLWRQVKGLAGVLGRRGGTSRDIRLTVRDRAAFRRSVARVLDWEFDNLVISHGFCVKGGAKDEVRRALAWTGAA